MRATLVQLELREIDVSIVFSSFNLNWLETPPDMGGQVARFLGFH
jgi:hypothetical protein